jgi:hypothetical protein
MHYSRMDGRVSVRDVFPAACFCDTVSGGLSGKLRPTGLTQECSPIMAEAEGCGQSDICGLGRFCLSWARSSDKLVTLVFG